MQTPQPNQLHPILVSSVEEANQPIPSQAPELGGLDRIVLQDAWERQRVYSLNARAAQNRFFALRLWIIRLAVFATLLAVVHAELEKAAGTDPVDLSARSAIELCLIIVPIIITVLLTGAMKFDRGYNWVLLRGSAETLKMEMYYYRTQVGAYSSNRNAELANKLKMISERLKGSPVHQASLNPYEREVKKQKGQNLKTETKGLPDLNAQEYIEERLEEQFNWYRKKTKELDQRLQLYFWLIYVLGGLGTLLAATHFGTWVAVTTALTAACANYLESKRDEETLIGYNQAADSLYNIRAWWNSLSTTDKAKQENLTLLVTITEGTIRDEHLSWLQDMQDRLAQLYGQQEDKEKAHTDSHPNQPEDKEKNHTTPSTLSTHVTDGHTVEE